MHYCQWLPENPWVQLIYLIYRWVVAVFFSVEIIVVGVKTASPKFFIYFGNLVFTVFVLYTVWSALSVTFSFLLVQVCCKERFSYERADDDDREASNLYNAPAAHCGMATNDLFWYQKVQWFLFTVGAEMAVVATVVYWALVHKPNSGFTDSVRNVPVHLLNAIVAILDAWLGNFPIRILHGVYMVLFGAGYQIFTGIYYATNGTNLEHKHYISHLLNYKTAPGVAAIIDIVIPFAIIPIIHLFFFFLYVLREGLLHIIKRKCLKRKRREPLAEERGEEEQVAEPESAHEEKETNPFQEELERELEREQKPE